ncbi:MAG: translation initiation factor IF-2 subunit gamma [Candidatus Altiarchaeales archaeon IMC4]|nr:MAG: translation initiation factor IF-2 subunit gamma [Candidatus Altiarchaeales archaeon IMC4]
MQSEINIGLVGHVDHGKTTLTKALSGVWTDRHSEEIKRGISIRLGYADCEFYKCKKCTGASAYGTDKKCKKCGGDAELSRKVSFVDSPGHETLMATMLSGAAMMDGALLVIAANEKCPQPQTAEHVMALDILGVKNIVVAQNKIDLVSKENAVENQKEIRNFLKGTVAENAPIVPIAAHYNANIDSLIEAIEENIPTPKRDQSADPLMFTGRSFDINHPGADISGLKGGVLGGTLLRGRLKRGDIIEIRPGVKKKNTYAPVKTTIISINAGGDTETAVPGGLIAIGTGLDPALTKSDNLSGAVVGLPGKLPDVLETLFLEVHLFKGLIGSEKAQEAKPLLKGEALMLSVGSTITVGLVMDPKKGEMKLKLPVCATAGSRVAISRRFGARWHLIGYGILK